MKFLQNDNIAFLCENIVFMSNLQPGLSGALFLFSQKRKKRERKTEKLPKKLDSKLSQMMIQMFCHHIIPFFGC